MVGEQTFRATERIFSYEELEPAHVKGKADPIPIWRPLDARSLSDIRTPDDGVTPLVGRDRELDLLKGLFERSASRGEVQFVTVSGEPGVGKSRLVTEFLSYLDHGEDEVRGLRGRCPPYGEGITFWALGEIVKAHAGILESDDASAAAAKLDLAIPEQIPDRPWIRQRLLPLIGLEASSSAEREEMFTAWRTFLETISKEVPTVLVFDDLHWADESMLAFLLDLAARSKAVGLLVIGTARPELYDRHPSFGADATNLTRLDLEPLSEPDTARLISSLLHQASIPAGVRSLLLERAGGNPLYAEEFVRLLQDRGLLVGGGRMMALADGADLAFPEGIRALVAARLDLLSAEGKATVQDAAVVGRSFWAGAVAAAGDLGPALSRALKELAGKELIRRSATSSIRGESTEFAFWHGLVQETAYAQIPRAQRSEKHRRVAGWIESPRGRRIGGLRRDTCLPLHAGAGTCAGVGRDGPGEGARGAPSLRFLTLAGERALGLDTARAETHFDRALRLAPPAHPQRPRILTRWADAVRQSGRQVAASKALEEAVATLRERGDMLEAAVAMTTLANVLWYMGDANSRHIAAQAAALLESERPGPALVEAYAELTRVDVLRGEFEDGIVWAERALAIAANLGLQQPAKALGYRGLARGELGDAAGIEDIRGSLRLALDRGLGWEAAVQYNNLGMTLWQFEGPRPALAALTEGMEFAERRGIVEFSLAVATLDVLVELGSWDEAMETADALAEDLEATGSVLDLLNVRYVQARTLALRGRAAEATALAVWVVTAARDAEAFEFTIAAFSSAALVYLGIGAQDRAIELLAEVADLPHARATPSYAAFLPSMVRTAISAGDLPLAEHLVEEVQLIYPCHENAVCAAHAAIAEAKGHLEGAVPLYEEAAARWQRFVVAPERASALLGQGRCLLGLGRPASASALLFEARGAFEGLGAVPALEEIDMLLRQGAAGNS